MTELYLYDRKVDSIFQLLGEHENDISCSVAWALNKCPSFLSAFVQKVTGHRIKASGTQIRLQKYETDGGFTDIEIDASEVYIIVEAKRGWNLPKREQLEKYASRFQHSSALHKSLVVLSECTQEYAELHLDVHKSGGVPIQPISWKDVTAIAEEARQNGSNAEKRLISELSTYLRGVTTMQKLDSNLVYVVALAQGKPEGWGMSWIDIEEKHHRYFHPVGGGRGGWPKEPPNYIAFRYNGKLQSIHHIEGYEVFTNPHEKFPEIPETKWSPHFLYKLGPAFSPAREVKTGKVYPNGRVWCMLDTLFTEDTISDARDLSKKRMQSV